MYGCSISLSPPLLVTLSYCLPPDTMVRQAMRTVRGNCSQVSLRSNVRMTRLSRMRYHSDISKLIRHLFSSNLIQQVKQPTDNVCWSGPPLGDDDAAMRSPRLQILSMSFLEVVPVVCDERAALRNSKRQLSVVIPVQHANVPSTCHVEAPGAQVVYDVNRHVLVKVQLDVQRQEFLICLFSH